MKYYSKPKIKKVGTSKELSLSLHYINYQTLSLMYDVFEAHENSKDFGSLFLLMIMIMYVNYTC